mmetsp:Transcript_22/g.75  ORF Transcript_22/g.75 Transcript_22/m.75 type:complete len:786 (+) Transcript_22:104-2461(+)|eukprot:CAMPEP_0170602372 /NCGR_PEP_ID=MMETSP0224-20130122/18354_1 /TAXON_ID=285029 /ORGANISM="Togula jolla, Strain CCCM 725" /LENGTH=785 /DNA_ID=CAMNT_0010927203 /DNA_START=36 /DNA_END=2393 /DNA_ORIENTATION=+
MVSSIFTPALAGVCLLLGVLAAEQPRLELLIHEEADQSVPKSPALMLLQTEVAARVSERHPDGKAPMAAGRTARRMNGTRRQVLTAQRTHHNLVADEAQEPEFQCASEYSDGSHNCVLCTMSEMCECDGMVKFGYGLNWTEWQESSGTVLCKRSSFGGDIKDPWIGQGKVCICQKGGPPAPVAAPSLNPPAATAEGGEMPPCDPSAPAWDAPGVGESVQCASEYRVPTHGCESCTMERTCQCTGWVRYGYGSETGHWTNWTAVAGSVECSNQAFTDPWIGHGKICECRHDAAVKTGVLKGAPWVETIVKSIIAVTLTYLTMSAILTALRVVREGSNRSPSQLEKNLSAAAVSSTYFAPMLCAVFFALIKRTGTLTNSLAVLLEVAVEQEQSSGAGGALPPLYLQVAVALCAAFFVGQSICSFCAQEKSGRTWRLLCNIFTAGMYVTISIVLLGLLTMQEPKAVFDEVGRTPIADGTVCTVILAIAYFGVHGVLYVLRNKTAVEFARGGPPTTFWLEVMRLAGVAMNFAPMMCVLFLGMQIALDWEGKKLPDSVKMWTYVSTFSLLIHVFLVIIAPFMASAELKVVNQRGEVDFVTKDHETYVAISMFRWVAMTLLYVGVAAVCVMVWNLRVVPPMSHTLCVVVAVYFVANLVMWVQLTLRQFFGSQFSSIFSHVIVERGVFCPMLATLFLVSWVRAHRFNNTAGFVGEPQSYAQDFMWIATFLVALQLIMVFASHAEASKPGLVKGLMGAYHTVLVMTYLCILVVIFGMLTITPQNADGRGAWIA